MTLDYQALGWSALAAAIAWALMELGLRWWARWSARRPPKWYEGMIWLGQPRLYPESLFVVQLSEAEVSCTRPNGTRDRVAWDDLQRVEIVTTDKGPSHPDVFWVLHGSDTGCVVPQGATGEPMFLERLQQLPGFRNNAVIEAMCSADNRRFLCWEKASGGEQVETVNRPPG